MSNRLIAYDTETTGLNPFKDAEIFAFSTCDVEGQTFVARTDGKDKLKPGAGLRKLKALWSPSRIDSIEFVMHNAKFDLKFTEKALGRDIIEDAQFHDTFIQSHILQNNHQTHRLKELAWELAGIKPDDEKAVKAYVTMKEHNYSHVPERIMREYAGRDAYRTMLLHRFFYPKIQANPNTLEIYNMEMDLIRATARMERRGIMLNVKRCKELMVELAQDAEDVLDRGERLLGKRWNFGNDYRIRELLFKELKIEPIKLTKKGKNPSVDKDSLAQMKIESPHAVLDLILKYRSWKRGVTTLGKYLEFTDENDIIHPSIMTCGAKTSREACKEPNMQNVAKEGSLLNPYPVPARKVFRPRPGFVNFHIDYSGIELRLLVHYSRDEILIDAINSGKDPHGMAAQIFYPAWTLEEIKEHSYGIQAMILDGFDAFDSDSSESDILRGSAKNTNFAVPYGANWMKASKTLGLPRAIGQKRFNEYRRTFPGLCNLNKTISTLASADGGITTAFGRFLRTPGNKPYIGLNFLVQGSAAGVVKRAQVRVHNYLEKATSGEAGILLPIHDEIIIEYPRSRLSEARPIFRKIRELMLDFPQFDVPLEVDIEVATVSWAKKNKFSLEDAA